jgi:hypothetical protein
MNANKSQLNSDKLATSAKCNNNIPYNTNVKKKVHTIKVHTINKTNNALRIGASRTHT